MKLTLANEGREAQQAEEEVLKRKRKAEDDVKWEGKPFGSGPWFCTSPLTSRPVLQRTAILGSIVGAALPEPTRRKRKPRLSFLDSSAYMTCYVISDVYKNT